ncbi:type II toxin-antitoxin system VapC family toxin [Halonotius terrestris]|uniref:Type II toxin-antitoxin system VapC family toxin n=1 Tax=Halonotius terrestris TaxID=2487750 RepID=A0A8J8TDW5_9EURY|nr:PIN domain-containing protein [Halonotius terrestris]TQQ83712.1 type II toxin-antitoxin system VapC family toxin [Halonotius terrestris]
MTVVFDAEPLLAFAFDEPGAEAVEDWLDRVYDGDRAGYVSTVNLAEFRYIAARKASPEQADAHISRLRELGVSEYAADDLWQAASELKVEYNPSLGDAYAVATAAELDADTDGVTLLVGADDDYDAFEAAADFEHLIERFRTEPA